MAANGGEKKLYTTPLELYGYLNSGIDLTTNIYKLNLINMMLNLQLNGSIGIMRTGVADSLSIINKNWSKSTLRNERTVTTRSYTLSGFLEFLPEERFSFRVCISNMWLDVRSPEIFYQPVINNKPGTSNQLRTLSFEGFLNMNKENSSRFFFPLAIEFPTLTRNECSCPCK